MPYKVTGTWSPGPPACIYFMHFQGSSHLLLVPLLDILHLVGSGPATESAPREVLVSSKTQKEEAQQSLDSTDTLPASRELSKGCTASIGPLSEKGIMEKLHSPSIPRSSSGYLSHDSTLLGFDAACLKSKAEVLLTPLCPCPHSQRRTMELFHWK